MIPPVNQNIWTEIRLIWEELKRLAKRQFDVINGVVNIGESGNIKLDPINNEINIKDKIKIKTNGTDEHEITIDDKIRFIVNGSDIKALFGANGEIELDAVNKIMKFGGNNLQINGTTSTPKILLNDGTNNRVLIGYASGKF